MFQESTTSSSTTTLGWPEKPGVRVHADYAGPFLVTNSLS